MESPTTTALNKAFPRAAQYDADWVKRHSYDGLTLYCLESLCDVLHLKKGMRVLDAGCGWAISSIFLAREFGAQVWALDNERSPSEAYRLACRAGCGDRVFPLQADARNLPFAEEFFDAIIAVDSYSYFGLDERYPAYIGQFLKPGGVIGILDGCFTREIEGLFEAPDYLKTLYHDRQDPWYCVHSVNWWARFLEKSGLFTVRCAEIVPESNLIWRQYIENCRGEVGEQVLIDALLHDSEKLMALFRLTACRRDD